LHKQKKFFHLIKYIKNLLKKIFIIIPAYNEEEKISWVIQDVKRAWFENIVIVDDWSTDWTKNILENFQNKREIFLVSHFVNKWAWAATQTWFDFALWKWAEIVVTIDADWQHNPDEIDKLVNPILEWKSEVVIWSRFLENQKMPIHRKIFNKIWNLITWFFFWLYVSDSQSWFKAFSKKALEKIQIENNWYEFCSEIIQKINSNNLNFEEVQISVKYTEYSQSKGQSLINWFKTLMKLFIHSLIK